MSKVIIAMSGGVDSSVAACLCMEAGHECLGVTMRLFDGEQELGTESTCCSLSDVEDARSVAVRLGMPYRVFNFTGDFENCVINPFIKAYETGTTPNPCIECNRILKFSRLHRRAEELGFDKVATGHYARISCDNEQLYSRELDAQDFNWIACDVPQQPLKAHVKIRYSQTEQPALLIPTGENTVHIEFDSPQRAVTTGQAAVAYDGDTVIGGGTIV